MRWQSRSRSGVPTTIVVATAVLLAGCGFTTTSSSSTGGSSPTATASPTATQAPTVPSAPTTGATPDATATSATDAEVQQYPDVIEVEAQPGATAGTWDVAATISSPYDTPERYADAFRVLADDGTELGVRELLHDHANEQPFTRSLVGLGVPDDVERITVEARDLQYGWGGNTVSVDLPR